MLLFALTGMQCWVMARETGRAETDSTNVWNAELAERAAQIFRQLPAPAIHYDNLSEPEVNRLLESNTNYQKFVREKLERKWFAALVSSGDEAPYAVQVPFATWRALVEFLAEKKAIVDVWAYGEAGEHKPRRIPAPELAALKGQAREQPTFVTATYCDEASGRTVSYRVEFGFHAAEAIWAAERAYQHHRSLELSAREILAAKNSKGIPDALAQWTALQNAIRNHRFSIAETPTLPTHPKDVFVAFEFEVDDQNNFSRALRVYRESEMERKVVGEAQELLIRHAGEAGTRAVIGFRSVVAGDQLEAATNAILGQDVVELRVKDPAQVDPRKWNVLQFGEPELLKASALAHFAQLNAYLERNRKARAMKQANVALVAEPIILGLNVGGGLAGLGFPAGESARLLYNLITFRLISQVPTAKQMRELFALMAARDRNPQIKVVPERYLSKRDIQTLKEIGRKLSDQEIETYLQQMSDEDVHAMLRLARQGMFDARVTNFLNILASTFKISGLSDEPGIIRDIFNNVRFSVNGDINISTLLLLALGKSEMTALSGVSLEELGRGEGPPEAWLQYLVVSVDIRAVLNTIVRLTKSTLAKKELEKPFPYSPRLSELAAYEIRIFGFPLLMYYKRGLIKDDRDAFEQDYAYGLYGVRLAEHFPTREQMEAEIHAGRMFPLGLVKVPSAGGWKETDLVVYAHRIPTGKFAGKTVLVIYGLKAYAEYSDLIGRELIRFRDFERGLHEGAVIEQQIWEPGSSPAPGLSYEPVIHVGSNAVAQIFSPLLGNLLELRRHGLRHAWGLPVNKVEADRSRKDLAALGIQPVGPDPLVRIDPGNSRFIYRRRVQGQTQLIKMVSIPGLSEMDRAMQKAEEERSIEEIRAEAAAGKSTGVVLLNEVLAVNGHLEMGPLLRSPQDQVVGAGVVSGASDLEHIFELLNRLPVTDRARLRANHFAATVVELERDDKTKQKVFLTVEFPLGETKQEQINPVTGERETVVYKDGLWHKTITDRRILEIEYSAGQIEIGSRTFANHGNRQAPVRGVLLEETKTVDSWVRDLTQRELDPYQPTIAKLHINYVTGALTRETYGLFVLPVETVDDLYITRNQFTAYGLLESAVVFENGREAADFLRPSSTRVLSPIVGEERFQLKSRLGNIVGQTDLSAAGYLTVLERRDLIKGVAKTETIDNASFGRKIQEEHTDSFDGTQSFSSTVTWQYGDDFYFGMVPRRAVTSASRSGTRLAELTTTAYDPLRRTLTGTEVSHTGRICTNTWDYRWGAPIEIETAGIKTVYEYNRRETASYGSTAVKAAGEVLQQATGQYDITNRTWRVEKRVWYRPDIPDHIETNTYSAFGMLISSRIGSILETRSSYTSDAVEQARLIFQRNPANDRYDILDRQQDDYHWQRGRLNARVRRYLEGSLADEYRIAIDDEGRTIEQNIRTWPGLDLETVLTYDGDSQRVLQAEALQNSQVRARYRSLGAFQRPDGAWLLRVQGTPFWGLTFTNSYLLGDPLGRVLLTEFENGDRSRVTEWFPNSDIPRISEVIDRQGHTKERRVKRVNTGVEKELPFDLVTLYKVSPWGETGLAEDKGLLRGTDVAIYSERPGERIYFDLSKAYDCPQYAIDPHRHFGVNLSVTGITRSNVTGIFASQFRDWREAGNTRRPLEPVVDLFSIGLPGFFSHPFAVRTFDRAGNLLEESAGKIKSLAADNYSGDRLLAEMARAIIDRRTKYRYQPGIFRDESDPKARKFKVYFSLPLQTNSETWKVNDVGWRDWPTEANTFRRRPSPQGGGGFYRSRRLHSPCWLKINHYLPDCTNVWVQWTATELNDRSETLFESQTIFNAAGEASTYVAHKVNGQGRPADKIVYQLPYPVTEDWRSIGQLEAPDVRIGLAGPQDLSSCDFIGFYLDAPADASVTVQFHDIRRRSVTVASHRTNQTTTLTFWPVDGTAGEWLPDETIPERGAAVRVPHATAKEGKLFVISVPDLDRAGLVPGSVTSVELDVAKSTSYPVKVTRLYRMTSGQRFLVPERAYGFYYDSQLHTSGLETFRRTRRLLSSVEARTDRGWNSVLKYEDTTVASLNPRFEPPYYSVLLVTDNSDPDAPVPLYTMAADDGRFLNYFETVHTGDTKVHTVVNGFDTPKLEVFRAGVLEDEISPGILALGYGYYVTVPLAKAGGGLSSSLAGLHNRCVASAFAQGADSLLRSVVGPVGPKRELGQLNRQPKSASSQAQEINQLPTLAEALLPAHQMPWGGTNPAPVSTLPLEYRTNALKEFGRLSGIYLEETRLIETRLIPTSPGTKVARYVDTSQEGAIIELAVKLQQPELTSLAGELLSFYSDQSQGGNYPLCASYDAKTGVSLTKRTEYKRASDSEITASAQLAIAQAAFCLGTTGDTNALEFGTNLLRLLLDKFRPGTNDMAWPRGIAEHPVEAVAPLYGVKGWRDPKTFSLASNARLYLLLTRLAEQADHYHFSPGWTQTILEAAREQGAWLTNRVLPYVEATGIVPKGLFEIQDLQNQTNALALDRWTSTEDWLSFVEAADRLGVNREKTRAWLDNLARVHGVTVNGAWGLDWAVAVRRPDTISTELTAKFLRVAKLLAYGSAAEFVTRNLNQLSPGADWPVLVTTASPNEPLKTGQGTTLYPLEKGPPPLEQNPVTNTWSRTLGVYAELEGTAWRTNWIRGAPMKTPSGSPRDITLFLWTAAGFYLSIIGAALFWWMLSSVRRRRTKAMMGAFSGLLVPESVMERAEERWAKRVLGMLLPPTADRSRYSNGAVEQNFHMQLRAIYKLVLEWRRVVNDWSEDDVRLVEHEEDPWVNGMDEFAVMVGIYSRWVVKAGRKDGCPKADILQENEDSNHIWSRLVMYFSESHLRLLSLLKEFKANPAAAAVLGINDEIELVLRMMGVRARPVPFDARTAFDAPAGASAMDLLLIQQPGITLTRVAEELEQKLSIPRAHMENFIHSYKAAKAREQWWPIHPYVLEAAKMLPHFLLMGLVALIWYINERRGIKIYVYLKQSATSMASDWNSLIWAVPLFVGFVLSAIARGLQTYQYRWGTQTRTSTFALDKDVTSFFGRTLAMATPALRLGGWWNPVLYQRAGWIFRAIGLTVLAVALFQSEPPSFATFMFAKGLLGVVLLLESACLLGPMLLSRFSAWLEDHVSANPKTWRIWRWLNQLNLVPTRPASLIWLSLKYHFQPSLPTGGAVAMLQAIAFYIGFAALFFVVGSYMFAQALELWFQGTYRSGRDIGLVVGGFLFWNTMYLLRFGLFVLITAISSAVALFPFKAMGALTAVLCLVLQLLSGSIRDYFNHHLLGQALCVLGALGLMAFEPEVLGWLRNLPLVRRRTVRQRELQRQALEQIRLDPRQALGVVYMSGDDLSFYKLSAELLMTRVQVLREKLGSRGLDLLSHLHGLPDDALLAQWFKSLYELEKRHEVTLWHPAQLVVADAPPTLPTELGLNLVVESPRKRDETLRAWHLRRWLVTMMSSAGHSQDTAINLVDIALAINQDGLAANTVFYLIQNKYDNNHNNRPSQVSYDSGELGQRNKLARLLMTLAPGCRAYSINDWTPFGFKAGGLVGMDLVYEESLRLTTMLLLDRNANTHDLEALMADIEVALSDPGVVIVIPGRSTTNTLTPIGQSSQLIEEGQRALVRGVMLLGGGGGESLGTGWGNIQAVHYGRVQRALCDVNTSKMPLTAPSERGATFGDRCEGIIGFGPHAVGISEDVWGVTQAAHNALALGYPVKFRRSQALWHKIRETWSHAEWLAAFPRWSGGYLQMMLDPLMQQINDNGPLSVFAKEIRANGGRFFLGAPAALLTILLMPIAIMADVSPFVQILILLWNLGLAMNQVLTALGFIACLEATGFNRITGLLGAFVTGIAVGTKPTLLPFGFPLLVLGFLLGGFALGFGRWLYYRGRDLVLFGPQLVIHTLGQIVRQSLEFVLSGAAANDAKAVNIPFRAWVGPREDRPFDRYQNLVNLRTVVWGVGLTSLLLDLFALANLDFLNVLLLLPSLMFSVSTLVGPYLMQPKPGKDLRSMVWIPKLGGWLASFVFYMLVAQLISFGGWLQRLGILFCLAVVVLLLAPGLKYALYSLRLRQVKRHLSHQLVSGGLTVDEARKFVGRIVGELGGDVQRTALELQNILLTNELRARVLKIVAENLQEFLKRPVTDLGSQDSASQRFVSEWKRSFVLGLFTFMWFFVVPLPGLLVFKALGGYRIWMSPGSLRNLALIACGVVFGSGVASLLLERWENLGFTGSGLLASAKRHYESFQSLAAEAGRLNPVQISHFYAMFTDTQTFLDQRSYAYAWRTLRRLENALKVAGESKQEPTHPVRGD
jgi:hypothetical protein